VYGFRIPIEAISDKTFCEPFSERQVSQWQNGKICNGWSVVQRCPEALFISRTSPPEPAVVPVPLTVKVPVALVMLISVVALVALIAWNVQSPVAVVTLTAVPVVDVTSLKVKPVVPLYVMSAAIPMVELTLLHVTGDAEVTPLLIGTHPGVAVGLGGDGKVVMGQDAGRMRIILSRVQNHRLIPRRHGRWC